MGLLVVGGVMRRDEGVGGDDDFVYFAAHFL